MIFSILTLQIFCNIIQAIYFFVHLFSFVTIFVFFILFSATKTVMIHCKILSKQSVLFNATKYVDDNGIFCNQQLIWDCILYIFCTLPWCGLTYWRWIVQTSCVTICNIIVASARSPQRGSLSGGVQCHYEGGTLSHRHWGSCWMLSRCLTMTPCSAPRYPRPS